MIKANLLPIYDYTQYDIMFETLNIITVTDWYAHILVLFLCMIIHNMI